MKRVIGIVIAIASSILISACGKSPAGPTSTTVAQIIQEDLTKGVYTQIIRYDPAHLSVNMWGNILYGLETSMNPDGSTLRVRVFSTPTVFATWVTGIYNGAPVGPTNNTTFRNDIPTPASSVDMTFTLEPFGCKLGYACWDKFVFRDPSRAHFLPDIYHLESRTIVVAGVNQTEIHVLGNIPPVQGSSQFSSQAQTGLLTAGLQPLAMTKIALAEEGYIDAYGNEVITATYIPRGTNLTPVR